MRIATTATSALFAAFLFVFTLADTASAVPFEIVNLDGPGEGFNDTTPASPVGGNTGTTIGEQRMIAFQYAADLWGARIDSDIPIKVEASFDQLSCNEFGAVLGQAAPTFIRRNFSGAPVSNTWYVPSLVNILAGQDLDPNDNDIFAMFNSELGQPGCLTGTGWYLGLDGQDGSDIDFVTVLLHELGHGLGFLSLVDLSTGEKFAGSDDAYMRHLEDHSTGKLFPNMSNSERANAQIDGSQNSSDLHWTGTNVIDGAAGLVASLRGQAMLTGGVGQDGHVEMYAPNPSEPGSSVSHYAKTLTPNELMEPSFTNALHNVELTLDLYADLGYPAFFACGDGTKDGQISATDALLALNVSVGASSCMETLCDVNATGATTATDALAILNAAVGQQIKSLEQELQVTLFDRGKRPPELNQLGLALTAKARDPHFEPADAGHVGYFPLEPASHLDAGGPTRKVQDVEIGE